MAVGLDVEAQPVDAGLGVSGEIGDPAVAVGHPDRQLVPAVAGLLLEDDPHARRRATGRRIQHMGGHTHRHSLSRTGLSDGQRPQPRTQRSTFASRSRTISISSSRTISHSASGSLPEPLTQGGQHLRLGAPGRADQEHVAEPLLVGDVSLAERHLRGGVGVIAGLLLTRPRRLLVAARRTVADPRVRGERLLQPRTVQRGEHLVRAGEHLVHRRVGTSGNHRVDPRAARADRPEQLRRGLCRHRVERRDVDQCLAHGAHPAVTSNVDGSCATIGGVQGRATVIRAAHVITPEGDAPACVVLRDGVITDVLPAVDAVSADAADLVDLPDDRVLLPGLVDTHVHVNEPGRTEWEGFATATAAAAAGGVTTIVDMPLNSIPPTVDIAALTTKRVAADGQLAVDVAFWGGAVPGNADALRELHDAGVVGFKCFLLPSGVDEFAPLDPDGLATAMRAIAAFDGLLIAHAEDASLIADAHGRHYADFVATRPGAAEVRAVESLFAQTRATGCRTHVVHVSSADVLPLVRTAKDEGLPVTAETCPHYLTLRAEDVPDGATQFKCCPPIRDDANRDALWAGLLDGTIDVIVSDHSPCTVDAKRLDTGDFGDAWGGIASVQLGLPIVWTEAARRDIGLDRVAHWMSAAPAAFAGLTGRGAIRRGNRADLCVLAPDETFVVDPALLRHRNPITPYAGRTLRGVVEQTWLAGAVITDGETRGELVMRG